MRLIYCTLVAVAIASCTTRRMSVVKLNGKFGCIDTKGNFIIPPTWDFLLYGSGIKQILVERDSLYGYIDRKGKTIIPLQYREGHQFRQGLAAVGNGRKIGFINARGDTVIPFRYDYTFMSFHNGLCDITNNDSCGFIDKKGNIIIPFLYRRAYPFLGDYAQVETFSGENLLVDKTGKTNQYNEVKKPGRLWDPLDRYPGSFTTSSGQGRMNSKSDTIVPPIYQVTGNLSDHMYIVKDYQKKWGAYNDKGKLTVIPQFEKMWHFHEGYANFMLNGKWGYAYVEKEGKAGFINKKGVFIVEPQFQPFRLGGEFE